MLTASQLNPNACRRVAWTSPRRDARLVPGFAENPGVAEPVMGGLKCGL